MHPSRIVRILVLAGLMVAATSALGDDAPVARVELKSVSCEGCNSGLLPAIPPPPLIDMGGPSGPFGVPLPGEPGCGCSCGGGPGCVPGRQSCCVCPSNNAFERFLCALYESVCCPDPCYEPRWYPLADTAFYTAAVRPVTQQRIRWDSAQNFLLPDRSEFFWARADGNGKGPPPSAPFLGEKSLRYNDLVLITEGGTGNITLIVETRYRDMQPELARHASGFADMVLGTKTLLFDSELFQASMQFMTYLPTGNFRKGLGTGHTSLEPSLLMGLKVSPTTYLQSQISEWIPLGGDPAYAGAVLHYHMALNQELIRFVPEVPLIATGEFNGWSFQDGLYTDPILGPNQKSSGTTYITLAIGLRLFVCDKMDIGVATSHAITEPHFARDTYTIEFRYRF